MGRREGGRRCLVSPGSGRSAVRFWRPCRWTLRGFPPGRTAPRLDA